MAVSSEVNAKLDLARGAIIVADDEDVAIEIEYMGSEASATVTVAADGNITFKHGDAASEANDTTIGGDADSGATIDVSESTEDTMGEVVDLINGSANWRARLVAALRSDSATDTLLAMAESTVNAGTDWKVSLYKDTSTCFNLSVALETGKFVTAADAAKLACVNEISTLAKVWGMTGVSTYASGTSKFQIYSVVTDRYGIVLSETKIFEEAAGNTTVSADASGLSAGLKPADREVGYKLIARLVNSAAMASAQLIVDGAAVNALAA